MRVVVAIDFGTSRTGYAFAFADDPAKKVYLRERWTDQPVPYPKTLTNLLYDPSGKLVAWGWSAVRYLARLKRGPDRGQYQHLTGFKMQLRSGRPSSRGPLFDDHSGRTFAAIELIGDYLREIRDLVMGDLRGAGTGAVRDQDVTWCLTVPAIWTEANKKAMEAAAERAGLIAAGESARLVFALEPEAAALHCQERDSGQGRSLLTPGARFMVVDAGGGTVDLTVHEVTPDNRLTEVAVGSGGACGSTYLDGEFSQFLDDLLGVNLSERLCEEEPGEYLELLRQWELAKCEYTGTAEGPVYLPVSAWLAKRLAEPENALALRRMSQTQDGDEDNIHLSPDVMRRLFDPVLTAIRTTIEKQFQAIPGGRCDYLFLVGGFAESPALRRMVETTFGGRVRVVVPPDPGRAVVVGAVHYALGQDRLIRRSRLTYGCRVRGQFLPGTDPESKKIWDPHHKMDRCNDVFDTFVTVGDLVPMDHAVKRTYYVMTPDQTAITVSLHITENAKVRHTDEPHVRLQRTIRIPMPDLTGGVNRSVEVSMYFGRTQVRFEVVNPATGESEELPAPFESTN